MVVDVQQGRQTDAALNLPCVHIHFDSKICAKEMEKIIRSLQNGMINVEAATTSEEHLEQKKKKLQMQETEEGHSGNGMVLENEDFKTPQAQSYSNTTRRFQMQCDDDDDQKNAQQRVGELKARTRVMNILHKFRDYCYKLSVLKQQRDISNEENGNLRRVDLQSAKKVKTELCYSTGKQQYLGEVPGVKIGDRFYYRMELHILGLHRPPQSGIETMGYEGQRIATSIVVSGGYHDYWKDADTLIYCGHGGGNNQEQVEDQKLKGGNLALLNSKRAKNPVRVIKRERKMKAYCYDQFSTIYIYDGLYTVEDMWEIRDSVHHRTVFNFKLVKISGQT